MGSSSVAPRVRSRASLPPGRCFLGQRADRTAGHGSASGLDALRRTPRRHRAPPRLTRGPRPHPRSTHRTAAPHRVEGHGGSARRPRVVTPAPRAPHPRRGPVSPPDRRAAGLGCSPCSSSRSRSPRRRRGPRGPLVSLAGVASERRKNPGGAGLAVCVGLPAPGPRGGLRRPVRRLRALSPAARGTTCSLVSGTDEHGTPVMVAADSEGSRYREVADFYNRAPRGLPPPRVHLRLLHAHDDAATTRGSPRTCSRRCTSTARSSSSPSSSRSPRPPATRCPTATSRARARSAATPRRAATSATTAATSSTRPI